MATNIVYEPGWVKSVVVTNPTTPETGDPVRYGYATGLALTDEGEGGNASTKTSVHFGPFVADLSVKGVDDNGNSAVAVGDMIFYVDADTPKLSKKSSGYFFGYALEAITSGSTDTINVQHVESPGSGSVAAGGISSTELASDAVTTIKITDANVTAAKLTATMQKGYIPLPMQNWRETATGAPGNIAANGGLLASDSTPLIAPVNGATDQQLRVAWAAGNADPIAYGGIVYPPDLDDAAAIEVHVLAAHAGATDHPAITVGFYEGVGDTDAGGATDSGDNSGHIVGTSITEVYRSIAAGDVGAHPKVCTVVLTPGTHATDILYVYGAWLEYTRK